jgi:hypothetical protein
LYITQELLSYATIAEVCWRHHRRDKSLQAIAALAASTTDQNIDWTTTTATPSNNFATIHPLSSSSSSSYHRPGAPWKVYSELCEAVLNLRRAILLHQSAAATEGKGGGRCM